MSFPPVIDHVVLTTNHLEALNLGQLIQLNRPTPALEDQALQSRFSFGSMRQPSDFHTTSSYGTDFSDMLHPNDPQLIPPPPNANEIVNLFHPTHLLLQSASGYHQIQLDFPCSPHCMLCLAVSQRSSTCTLNITQDEWETVLATVGLTPANQGGRSFLLTVCSGQSNPGEYCIAALIAHPQSSTYQTFWSEKLYSLPFQRPEFTASPTNDSYGTVDTWTLSLRADHIVSPPPPISLSPPVPQSPAGTLTSLPPPPAGPPTTLPALPTGPPTTLRPSAQQGPGRPPKTKHLHVLEAHYQARPDMWHILESIRKDKPPRNETHDGPDKPSKRKRRPGDEYIRPPVTSPRLVVQSRFVADLLDPSRQTGADWGDTSPWANKVVARTDKEKLLWRGDGWLKTMEVLSSQVAFVDRVKGRKYTDALAAEYGRHHSGMTGAPTLSAAFAEFINQGNAGQWPAVYEPSQYSTPAVCPPPRLPSRDIADDYHMNCNYANGGEPFYDIGQYTFPIDGFTFPPHPTTGTFTTAPDFNWPVPPVTHGPSYPTAPYCDGRPALGSQLGQMSLQPQSKIADFA